MWNKPWRLAEGLVIGSGLVVTGLLLQFTAGPVNWDLFAWPVNALMLTLMAVVVAVLWWAGRCGVYAWQWLGSLDNAITSIAWVALVTIVMGLTRQVPATAPALPDNPLDRLGLTRMLSFWPLVLLYLWLTLSLAVVVVQRCTRLQWRNVPFLLMHAGLLLVLVAATLGSADMKRLKMYVGAEQPEWRAIDDRGQVTELPLAVELEKFVMEVYDDSLHTPKRYASQVTIFTRKGEQAHTTIEVNQPADAMGWKIYQYGYDRMPAGHDRMLDVSILELVRDPWLPAVYAGVAMLLAGALCLLFMNPKRHDDDLGTV